MASDLEDALVQQIMFSGLQMPRREYQFAKPRRWRFDLAWPEKKLAVEAEGGLYVYGRHQRPQGMEHDMEKYNQAALQGWVLLRVSRAMIRDGRAMQLIERALREAKP